MDFGLAWAEGYHRAPPALDPACHPDDRAACARAAAERSGASRTLPVRHLLARNEDHGACAHRPDHPRVVSASFHPRTRIRSHLDHDRGAVDARIYLSLRATRGG